MIIGIIGGTIEAIAIWVGECMTCCSSRMCKGTTTNGVNESSHVPEPTAGRFSNGEQSRSASNTGRAVEKRIRGAIQSLLRVNISIENFQAIVWTHRSGTCAQR